jgi:hypothetical protein
MSARISVVRSQRRLLGVWAGTSIVAAIMVLVQTSPGGAYHSSATDVWEWFLPTVVPTMSLMLGTVVAEARGPGTSGTVDVFYYRLALWTSLAYLALVLGLLLSYAQSPTPVADLKSTSRLVTGLYTLVGVALGTFFVSKKSE